MMYVLRLQGPKGYGFLPWALPEHLQRRPYRVVEYSFEPDGGTYVTRPPIPHAEIPTGLATFILLFT